MWPLECAARHLGPETTITEYLKSVFSRAGWDNVNFKHRSGPLDLEAIERFILAAKSPRSYDVATLTFCIRPPLYAPVECPFLWITKGVSGTYHEVFLE